MVQSERSALPLLPMTADTNAFCLLLWLLSRLIFPVHHQINKTQDLLFADFMCQRWDCVALEYSSILLLWLYQVEFNMRWCCIDHMMQFISCQSPGSSGQVLWAVWHEYEHGYCTFIWQGTICAQLCNIMLFFNISLWCSCKCLFVPSDDFAFFVFFVFNIVTVEQRQCNYFCYIE